MFLKSFPQRNEVVHVVCSWCQSAYTGVSRPTSQRKTEKMLAVAHHWYCLAYSASAPSVIFCQSADPSGQRIPMARGKQRLSNNTHLALLKSVTSGNLQLYNSHRTSSTQLLVILLARGRLFFCHPGNAPGSTLESQKPINPFNRPIFYILHPLWQSILLATFFCIIGQTSLFQWFWFHCFMILEVAKWKVQFYSHTRE